MLERRHRFHGYNALSFAYQHGAVVRGRGLTLRYIVNRRQSTYRVAVVVSKKVSKSAVVRNRIRRRVYEVARQQISDDTAAYDLILSVHDAAMAVMPIESLQTLVVGQLRQAGVVL